MQKNRKRRKDEKMQKSILFLLGILFLISLTSAKILTCSDNPMAIYHFNNNSNAECSAINGVDGNVSYVLYTGKYSQAVWFNNQNQVSDVNLGNNFNFERNMNFSVTFWTKLAGQNGTPYQSSFFRKAHILYGAYTGYFLGITSDAKTNQWIINNYTTSNFIKRELATSIPCGVPDLSSCGWTFIAVTYDGSSSASGYKIYINGELKSPTTMTDGLTGTILTSIPFRFGQNLQNGLLDEAGIFNRTLTDIEVLRYYRENSNISINFTYPSDSSGYANQNYILVNITSSYSPNNFTNLTIYLFNETSLVGFQTFTTKANSYYKEFLNLSTGNYSFYAKTFDDVGISNQTEIRYLNLTGTCIPEWTPHNTTCGFYCGSWDKFQTYYTDNFNCGNNISLPADNGTCYYCDYCVPSFSCSAYSPICAGFPPTSSNCTQANDTTSCCSTTGLSSDCVYTGNLSDFNLNYTIDMLDSSSLIVTTYPYVKVNTSYNIKLSIPTNNLSDMKLFIQEPSGTNSTFNLLFSGGNYQTTLIFTEIGDYYFKINGTNPCGTIAGEITGVLYVRDTFNVTFCGFELKDKTPYINDFAFLTAEFTDTKFYNTQLERYITPLGFKTLFKTPVFYTNYIDGCGTLILYEDTNYAIRLWDGEASFLQTYSSPNITKTYGTNIYIGKYDLIDGENYDVFLSSQEISPYRYLANIIFIIAIIVSIVVAIFLFFVIPEKPNISIIFGIGFTIMIVILRIILWLWKGYVILPLLK